MGRGTGFIVASGWKREGCRSVSPTRRAPRWTTTRQAAPSAGRCSSARCTNGHSARFFFLNYEATRINRGRTVPISVPTAAQRGGDFTALGSRSNRLIFDPATTRPNPTGPGFIRDAFPNNTIPANRISSFARGVLEMYPGASCDAAAGSNYFGSFTDKSDGNQVLLRVDHRLNDRATVFARYALFDGVETSGSPIRLSGSATDVRTHNFVANATKIIGAASVLSSRRDQPAVVLDPAGRGVREQHLERSRADQSHDRPRCVQVRVFR